MKLKLFYLTALALLLFICQSGIAQTNPPGIFDGRTDVGDVNPKGTVVYNPETQQYTLSGAGTNIWLKHDDFSFLWKKIKGDFILRANVQFIGKGATDHRKIGVMARSSLNAGSKYVDIAVHGVKLVSMQYRLKTDDSTHELVSKVEDANVVQLERRGNVYTMSVAKKGDPFTSDTFTAGEIGDEVYAGLFICSHNKDVTEKAIFSNVRVIIPARPDFTPYRDYIGSNIELLDMATQNSRIIFQYAKSIQAPNWMKDGKSLLYNKEGLLYTFNLATSQPQVLNTGEQKKNNNDHVISFNGKMLAISSSGDDGKSVGWVMPITGGTPKRLTTVSPSYMHSWSPDGRYLIFTSQREGNFDIYRVPSTGGAEVRLTTDAAYDDGSEYTPDGKYIYFNSVRSGHMQIWRMNSDGSEQTQITHSEFDDWFPHISPDGKWIVYISFLQSEVKPDDHPFYRHVYLQVMPINGGPSKVIAYVYGGQGTINTPSWSPDGKHIAFVSNTDLLFPVFPTDK